MDEMINTYMVDKKDVVAKSGTSETGVSWDIRVRAGKATITVEFTFSNSEFDSFASLTAPETFGMTYQCRGSELTGTFRVRESNESMITEDLWDVKIRFEEM